MENLNRVQTNELHLPFAIVPFMQIKLKMTSEEIQTTRKKYQKIKSKKKCCLILKRYTNADLKFFHDLQIFVTPFTFRDMQM